MNYKIKSYDDCIRFLHSFTDYERMSMTAKSQLNLDRMAGLHASLGSPSDRYRCVHVAGTKGKGSTAAFIAAALGAGGEKVGLYTSPHVTGLRERIQVSGRPIQREALTEIFRSMQPYLAALHDAGDPPTFFEILTAAAFLHFARERVAWAVVEVGLGGRLDATNVLKPAAVVITRIGLDHQEILGHTVGAIAHEKAGIVKPGAPVFTAAQDRAALEAIREAAERAGVPLYAVGSEIALAIGPPEGDGIPRRRRFNIRTPWGFWEGISPGMPGRHQGENAALALTAIDALRRGPAAGLPAEAVRAAVARTTLPGRVEYVPGDPALLVDGAHNPDAVDALLDALDTDIPHGRLAVVFACQKDKDAAGMLTRLAARAVAVVMTRTDNPRAADPEALARLARGVAVETAPTPPEALAAARRLAGPRGLVCATGSLYLAGAVRRAALGDAGTD